VICTISTLNPIFSLEIVRYCWGYFWVWGPSLPHSVFGFLLREPSRLFEPRIELRNVLTVPSSLDDSDALSICRSPGLRLAFLFFSLMYVYHKKTKNKRTAEAEIWNARRPAATGFIRRLVFVFCPIGFRKTIRKMNLLKFRRQLA